MIKTILEAVVKTCFLFSQIYSRVYTYTLYWHDDLYSTYKLNWCNVCVGCAGGGDTSMNQRAGKIILSDCNHNHLTLPTGDQTWDAAVEN